MASNSFEIRITRDSQGRYQASCPSIPRFSPTAFSVSDALCKLGNPIQEYIERSSDSEGSPNLTLPFFAYGIFKGGELGFLQIMNHVESIERDCRMEHARLWIRDGLPICIPSGDGDVVASGDILTFKPEKSREAYERIFSIEPKRIYEWKTGEVSERTCNYLAGTGADPTQGAYKLDMPWEGKKDHLFTTALDIVRETASLYGAGKDSERPMTLRPSRTRRSGGSMRDTFQLQMAYMLLWASIERYGAFRHGLFKGPVSVIDKIGKEPSFVQKICEIVQRTDRVFAANGAKAEKNNEPYLLDTGTRKTAANSIHYYYQIRCNATHRGKGGGSPDHEKLLNALSELLPIFEYVKDQAFEDSCRKAKELAASATPDTPKPRRMESTQ